MVVPSGSARGAPGRPAVRVGAPVSVPRSRDSPPRVGARSVAR
ncbi:hypothetical protein Ae706Ps2_1592 [Pseudonocardia sp. Ae706_Ps2]|nr:hypothetical protein Ae706Ps2_1592 [Pseudonocardia sp. Ae706_Ps2]